MSVNSDFIKKAEALVRRRKAVDERENIEEPFVRYAKRRGCLAVKLVLLSGRGFPDRTVLVPGGTIFFIEFKRPGKDLSKLQEKWRKRLVDFGFKYFKCDSFIDAKNILEDMYL